MTFGEYFRELRKENFFSQKELADKIGVSYTYISKIENDVFPPPSVEMLEKVANVYKMENANELLIEAKIIPQDVKEMIKNDKELLRFLIETPIEDILKIKNEFYKNK